MIFRKFALVAALFSMAGGAQAVTLDIVGGQLMGASDVSVDGALYDVQFRDGTCIGLFNGCDDISDFAPIQSSAFAQLAMAALEAQVFINTGVAGEEFSTNPTLTNGCSDASQCWVRTPLSLFSSSHPVGFVNVAVLTNFAGTGFNIKPGFEQTFRDNDTGDEPEWVYAVWTAVAEPVPVPALPLPGIALLVASLLGVGAGSLRRPRRASPRPGLI